MQAIERMPLSNNWLTFILLLLFLILFISTIIDTDGFKEVAYKLFKISLLERTIDENYSFLSVFHVLFTLFSVTVLSLLFFDVKVFYDGANALNFHWACTILFVINQFDRTHLIFEHSHPHLL